MESQSNEFKETKAGRLTKITGKPKTKITGKPKTKITGKPKNFYWLLNETYSVKIKSELISEQVVTYFNSLRRETPDKDIHVTNI